MDERDWAHLDAHAGLLPSTALQLVTERCGRCCVILAAGTLHVHAGSCFGSMMHCLAHAGLGVLHTAAHTLVKLAGALLAGKLRGAAAGAATLLHPCSACPTSSAARWSTRLCLAQALTLSGSALHHVCVCSASCMLHVGSRYAAVSA